MSDSERPGHQLLCELHDFERRYNIAKGQLSADEVCALWSVLWRFSENVMVDHRLRSTAYGDRLNARRRNDHAMVSFVTGTLLPDVQGRGPAPCRCDRPCPRQPANRGRDVAAA